MPVSRPHFDRLLRAMNDPSGINEDLEPERLDRLVHEPVRLAVLTVLQRVASAEFAFLVNVLGVTPGNLSSHLTKLRDAGLVSIMKSFDGNNPLTTVAITAEGRDAVARHWARLDAMRGMGTKQQP